MCIYCIYNKNVCSTEGPVSKSFQLLSDDAAAVMEEMYLSHLRYKMVEL